jgi:hypothetical protein
VRRTGHKISFEIYIYGILPCMTSLSRQTTMAASCRMTLLGAAMI